MQKKQLCFLGLSIPDGPDDGDDPPPSPPPPP